MRNEMRTLRNLDTEMRVEYSSRLIQAQAVRCLTAALLLRIQSHDAAYPAALVAAACFRKRGTGRQVSEEVMAETMSGCCRETEGNNQRQEMCGFCSV